MFAVEFQRINKPFLLPRDRLVHHAHVIALDGDSYRTRKHRTGPPPTADTTSK